jgi:hypothetical protein
MDLKNVLGEIKTDRGNLHLDGSPQVIRHNDHPMALRCRERAPSTTSILAALWTEQDTVTGVYLNELHLFSGGRRPSNGAPVMESSPPRSHHSEHQRRTKFTPERIRQITNLVERGTTPAEIAEIVGVTLGTLKTTCSKLHISLRRPSFDTGTGLLRLRRRRGGSSHAAVSSKKMRVEAIPSQQEPANILESETMRAPRTMVSFSSDRLPALCDGHLRC